MYYLDSFSSKFDKSFKDYFIAAVLLLRAYTIEKWLAMRSAKRMQLRDKGLLKEIYGNDHLLQTHYHWVSIDVGMFGCTALLRYGITKEAATVIWCHRCEKIIYGDYDIAGNDDDGDDRKPPDQSSDEDSEGYVDLIEGEIKWANVIE
jgi:hypothetical protein